MSLPKSLHHCGEVCSSKDGAAFIGTSNFPTLYRYSLPVLQMNSRQEKNKMSHLDALQFIPQNPQHEYWPRNKYFLFPSGSPKSPYYSFVPLIVTHNQNCKGNPLQTFWTSSSNMVPYRSPSNLACVPGNFSLPFLTSRQCYKNPIKSVLEQQAYQCFLKSSSFPKCKIEQDKLMHYEKCNKHRENVSRNKILKSNMVLVIPSIDTDSVIYNKSNNSERRKEWREVYIFPLLNETLLYWMPTFLTPDECENLLQITAGRWERSKTSIGRMYQPSEEYQSMESASRTSWSAFISRSETPLVASIERRVAAVAGVSVSHVENLVIVKYDVGQFFKLHHDGDFRIATVLIYLNDVEEGGETDFPYLGLKVKPEMGSALYWKNLDDSNDVEMRLYHSGLPPIKGVKYAINCFVNKDIMFTE